MKTLLILLAVIGCGVEMWSAPGAKSASSASITVNPEPSGFSIQWPGSAKTYHLSIDDSPQLRAPILATDVPGNVFTGNAFKLGLAPGVLYYVDVEPGSMRTQFRLPANGWPDAQADYSLLRRTWELSERYLLHAHSGLSWNDSTQSWQLDPQWNKEQELGHEIYYLEPPLRAAIEMGYSCHDLPVLNEVAQFFIALSARSTTLGDLRKKSGDTSLLKGQGPDNARTFLWVESGAKSRVRECPLCSAQFFHPAARLIRIITLLPASDRTPAMLQVVKLYTPLIVRDHLIRQLYQAEWDHYGAPLPKEEVEVWKALQSVKTPPKKSYQYAMQDVDLWLIAAAAEMLGAHANDPTLVSLTSDEQQKLEQAVQAGVGAFQHKRTVYPDTKNFNGVVVKSASYFDGDLTDHPDSQYAGYKGHSFPTPGQKQPQPGVSWDISHFHRVPVMLRALYDNRKATHLDFPTLTDLELITSQLMYRVFKGDFQKPLFNNYFDGSNGWYRVAYTGSSFGYPPVEDCDGHDPNRPCDFTGGIEAWGLLAFANNDLQQLEHSFLRLAVDQSPQARQFADRYYWYDRQGFKILPGSNGDRYPELLFDAISSVPYKLHGCPNEGASGK